MSMTAPSPSRRTLFESEHDEYRASYRTFIEREVKPHYAEWEKAQLVPRELFTKAAQYKNEVYVLPKHLDEKVAALHLEKLGVKLTTLTKAQADYIGVPVEGPFKADHYRY